MASKPGFHLIGIASLLLAFFSGCSRSTSSAVKPPKVNPAAATTKALESYDTDGDGHLDAKELESCSAILASLSNYDTDGDKQVSADELTRRLEAMYATGTGLMSVRCRITKQQRPVSGATVRFVPEEFLGGVVEAAEGVTDRDGFANMAIPDDRLPEDQRGLNMMQVGVYRVEIEHPQTEVSGGKPLGAEIDPTSQTGGDVAFDL